MILLTMNAQKAAEQIIEIDREKLKPKHPARFQPGNRAHAKPKWSLDRIRRFQKRLATFRQWLNYSHAEMGQALGFSASYIKLLEGGYPSDPDRQPSDKFVKQLAEMEKSARPKKKFHTPAKVGRRASELWSHVLAHKFKCRECAAEVKRGEREPGLEYWWGTANQRYCPDHQPYKRRKAKRWWGASRGYPDQNT